MRILPAIVIGFTLLAPLAAQAPPVGPDDPLPPGAVARTESEASRVMFDADGKPLPEGAVCRIGTRRLRHSAQPNCAAFSPNGRWLASGGSDSYVRLWDIETGAEEAAFRHEMDVRSIAFSPDGKRLASASQQGGIAVWDLADKREFRRFGDGERSSNSVRFMPGGERIIAGGDGDTIRVWEIGTGREVGRMSLPEGFQEFPGDMALQFDPLRMAVRQYGGAIHVYDPVEGRRLHEHRDSPWADPVYLPNGGPLLTADSFGLIHRWDSLDGSPRGDISLGDNPNCMSASPDGRQLAIGGDTKQIQILNPSTGIAIRQWPVPDRVQRLAFSPDGQTLASVPRSGGGDLSVRLWDVATGRERTVAPGNCSMVSRIVYSPDATLMAFAGYRDIYLADPVAGRVIRILQGHALPVWSIAFSPDGKTLASSGGDDTIRIWDVATGVAQKAIPGHGIMLSVVTFTPDGGRLISSGIDERLCFRDARTGELREEHKMGRPVGSVAVSPDGKTVALGTKEAIVLWDIGQKKAAADLPMAGAYGGFVHTVAFSRDGSVLLSQAERNALFWNVAAKHPRLRIRMHDHWIALSPDGQTACHAVHPNRLRLVDTQSGETLTEWTGHEAGVNSIAYSPNGRSLATGGFDTTVLVWDLDLLRKQK